ncbi:3-deoxy-D-manno-octulosonate 8-phosphate phosphatase [hydrothermal vent metagenome]|uniref:3-deoxy-D-manno-octulosonate 8-phosphate phosphatase KdsC n=1 Tax=hydrothermal vent metagenome TaxID=652676 RepID=A0A3B0V663_9ZZZZ
MNNRGPCPPGKPQAGETPPSGCEPTRALPARARSRTQPVERSAMWKAALPRAKQVQILLLDVDGVLTDGTIIYTHDGDESKGFNTKDGFGLWILQEAGVEVGLITARSSASVSRRAADLKMKYVVQGTTNKMQAYEDILLKSGLRPEQTAYMGDDWLDLPLLKRVGLAATPADGMAEVRSRVHFVTSRPGGHGAVREVCDLILEARGQLASMFATYSG